MDTFLSEWKGRDRKGDVLQIVHIVSFGEDRGHAVMVLRGNYNQGRVRWSWRAKTQGQTLDEAIKTFKRLNADRTTVGEAA
jgi:hypothetical protein